jgi:sugar lactone lactonase YvrE
MRYRQGFSRRHMLAVTAAAGGIAAGGFGGQFGVVSGAAAQAQAAKRIDQFDPALDNIISTSEPIIDLTTNLGGVSNVEGPLWWKEGGFLLFRGTDYRRWKYAPGQPLSVFKENTNAANGITRDMQGRLVACEAATRRIVREEHDGSITVMASGFQGRPFNRPNDIVVRSDGAIYFTDPWTVAEPPGENDLTFAGVFRISPDRDTLTLLADDFLLPNGLAFSPDESVLYINDSRRRHIRAFALAPNGTLARQTDRGVC